MNPRSSSTAYGVRSFATLLICRYRVSPGSTIGVQAHKHITGDMRLFNSKMGYGIGSSMHQALTISRCNSTKRPESKMEQEDTLQVLSSDPDSPKPSIFYWVKWVLGTILPLLFSSWKQKWDNMLKLEDKLEEVVKEVEEVAEVVEKVASTTEKLSAEVAENLNNGEMREIALMVEHVSSVTVKDARMTQNFLHKVGDLKQDLAELENLQIC
ncbi:unnamed protein product [Lactuca saligna]|uniref:Uncharacterized protein n=1 Tax=Lactuca saligna TaxID=75948 RepID=A0AA36E8G0_LACSI|nr:unnamed protein product [Lactuca saligna]